MPTYEYLCEDCNIVFEIEKGIKDKRDDITCPICNMSNIKIIISGASFVLSGDCWAKDGYTRNNDENS